MWHYGSRRGHYIVAVGQDWPLAGFVRGRVEPPALEPVGVEGEGLGGGRNRGRAEERNEGMASRKGENDKWFEKTR